MKKDIFNEWYRNRFNQLREQPPADLWESIANELDVQEVWERVDSKLTITEARTVLRRRMAWAASLLLLVVGGVLLKYSMEKKETRYARMSPVHNSSSRSSLKKDKASAHDVSVPADQSNTGSTQPGAVTAGNFTSPFSHKPHGSSFAALPGKSKQNHRSKKQKENDAPAGASGIDAAFNGQVVFPVDTIYLSSIAQDSISEERPVKDLVTLDPVHLSPDSFISTYRPVFAGFSAGPAASVSNVWLLNHTTIAGLKNSALYQTDVTFGRSYGLSAVYDTKGKWGAQADLMMDTEMGQDYHYYDEGAYVTKIISSHYYQVSLLGRKKKASRFFNTSLPASRVWIFGPEARLMKSILVDVDRPMETGKAKQSRYSRFDYGLHFGYQYDLQVHRRLVVSSGIAASIGLNNINRGQGAEPGKFNNTYNAAAGVQLGIRYMLASGK